MNNIALDAAATKRTFDNNGFMTIKDNVIAKSDILDYNLSELYEGVKAEDDKVVSVLKDWNSLKEHAKEFKSKPFKWLHAWMGKEGKGDEGNKADGTLENIRINDKEKKILADIVIYNQDLINDILAGNLNELSPGTSAVYEKESGILDGKAYDYRQFTTGVNHLAIVPAGRAGADVRVQDSKTNLLERIKMKKRKKIMDASCGTEDSSNQDVITKLAEINESGAPDNEKLGAMVNIIKEALAEGVEDKRLKRAIYAIKGIAEGDDAEEDKKRDIEDILVDMADWKSEDEDIKKTEDEDDDDFKKDSEDEDIKKTEDEDDDDTIRIDKETLEKIIESKVEDKIRKVQDAERSKIRKVQDAYTAVKNVINCNFDISGKSEADIYRTGYEILTNEKLNKAMDAKTAFNIVAKTRQKQNITKVQDSAFTKKDEFLTKLERL